MRGEVGADVIRGDDGDDDLRRQLRRDVMRGGAGDDSIEALGDGSVDTVRGGPDFDEACFDLEDHVSGIEQIVLCALCRRCQGVADGASATLSSGSTIASTSAALSGP